VTITTPAYPACTTAPCIDPAFGPTVAILMPGTAYWSATTETTTTERAWNVDFLVGGMGMSDKVNGFRVRSVRSGL